MNRLLWIKNYLLTKYYSLRDQLIPEDHHIARYLRPSDVDNECVNSTGFQYKKHKNGELKEQELSTNWLEFFGLSASEAQCIEHVKQAFHDKQYTLKPNGRFVALHVKRMRDEVQEGTKEHTEQVSLLIKHTAQLNDLSHSSIFGIPFDDDGEKLVSAILANYANECKLYPAMMATNSK